MIEPPQLPTIWLLRICATSTCHGACWTSVELPPTTAEEPAVTTKPASSAISNVAFRRRVKPLTLVAVAGSRLRAA